MEEKEITSLAELELANIPDGEIEEVATLLSEGGEE